MCMILTVEGDQLTADEKREERPKTGLVGIVLSGADDLDQLEINLLHHIIGVMHMVVPFHEPANLHDVADHDVTRNEVADGDPTMKSYQTSAAASSATFARTPSSIALRIVTTGSTNAMPFDAANIAFIVFAAIGAQVPFSMKATWRFW